MSKKQVVLMSFLVAVPAIGLLLALVMNGLNHGGNMFSGMMTVIVAISGILVLCLGLSPFVLMGLYPADGFAAMGPPPSAAPGGQKSAADDDEDDGDVDVEDDGFGGGRFEEDSADDDGFEHEAEGEELFDDGYDEEEFDDDLGGFEEDDDEDWK